MRQQTPPTCVNPTGFFLEGDDCYIAILLFCPLLCGIQYAIPHRKPIKADSSLGPHQPPPPLAHPSSRGTGNTLTRIPLLVPRITFEIFLDNLLPRRQSVAPTHVLQHYCR